MVAYGSRVNTGGIYKRIVLWLFGSKTGIAREIRLVVFIEQLFPSQKNCKGFGYTTLKYIILIKV